jgi:hypothetical protein
MRFQTSFGGGNLNVNNFHHQIRFGIWNETVYIWNAKWREVGQFRPLSEANFQQFPLRFLIFFPKNISKIWNTPCEGVVGNM